MRIRITSENKKYGFIIPNSLLFSRLGAKVLSKSKGMGNFPDLKDKDMRILRKTVKKMKQIHKNWCLVDFESADGERVMVRF